MIAPVADHLWQSTAFAAVAALLAWALRRNQAHVRHWIWLVASIKFLVPFGALVMLGQQVEWKSPAVSTQPTVTFFVSTVSQPFARPQLGEDVAASPRTGSAGVFTPSILLIAIWLTGLAVMLLTWWVRWRRIACLARQAAAIEPGRELSALRHVERICGIRRPLRMVESEGSLEPGVFGILNPVLLWPRSINARLADAQIEAILAHEVAHVRRRDNLASAVHLLVQSVCWFHPLVWWIGGRLVDERERACDEDVIRMGSEPQTYAESILNTCEFYAESPLISFAGVTGADLKKRIEGIMRGRTSVALHGWKKALLGAAGLAALAGPVGIGVLTAPPARAETQAPAPTARQKFEVASVKPNKSADNRASIGIQPGGHLIASNVPLRMLVRMAFQVQPFQIVGGPDWITSERFDINARAEGELPPDQPRGLSPMALLPGSVGPMQLMLQSLLADRFMLDVHHEEREMPVYSLVIARADGRLGPELRRSTVDCQSVPARGRGDARVPPPPAQPGSRQPCTLQIGAGRLAGGGFPLSQLASALSNVVQRIVVDRTGLTGNVDFDLTFTPDQPQAAPPGDVAPPIDPNAPSIFTALQEQLGLKLESERGPVDVLVIDRVERPREN